jgi:hypothetical protein
MPGSHQIKETDKIKIIKGPNDKEGCSTVRVFLEKKKVQGVFYGDDSGFRCFEFCEFFIVCLKDVTFEGTAFFVNFISKKGLYIEFFAPVNLNSKFFYKIEKFYNNFIEIIIIKDKALILTPFLR